MSTFFSSENGGPKFLVLNTNQPKKVFSSIRKDQFGFLLGAFHESKNYKKLLVLHQSQLIYKGDLPWTTLEERSSMV